MLARILQLVCFIMFANLVIAVKSADFRGQEVFPGYSAQEAVDASLLETQDEEQYTLYDTLNNVDRVISIYDFLRAPFDPVNNSADKEALQYFLARPGFRQARESLIRAQYYMDAASYDRLHGRALLSLRKLAGLSGITLGRTLHYATVLSEIEDSVSKKEGMSFAEVGTELAALHESSYLFENRYTTMSALEEDALVMGLGDAVKKFATSIKSIITSNMCSWCVKALDMIVGGGCSAVSSFICNAVMKLLGGVSGGVLAVLGRFLCGFPINLSAILARWCEKGIKAFKSKIKMSNRCICGKIRAGFTIPSVSIPFGGKTSPVSIGASGTLCPAGTEKQCSTETATSAVKNESLKGALLKKGGKAIAKKAAKALGNVAKKAAGKVAGAAKKAAGKVAGAAKKAISKAAGKVSASAKKVISKAAGKVANAAKKVTTAAKKKISAVTKKIKAKKTAKAPAKKPAKKPAKSYAKKISGTYANVSAMKAAAKKGSLKVGDYFKMAGKCYSLTKSTGTYAATSC